MELNMQLQPTKLCTTLILYKLSRYFRSTKLYVILGMGSTMSRPQ